MEQQIYEVIKKYLKGVDHINFDTTLVECGMDSIEFITMIIALEEEFGIRFEDIQLIFDEYKTVGDIVKVVHNLVESNQF